MLGQEVIFVYRHKIEDKTSKNALQEIIDDMVNDESLKLTSNKLIVRDLDIIAYEMTDEIKQGINYHYDIVADYRKLFYQIKIRKNINRYDGFSDVATDIGKISKITAAIQNVFLDKKTASLNKDEYQKLIKAQFAGETELNEPLIYIMEKDGICPVNYDELTDIVYGMATTVIMHESDNNLIEAGQTAILLPGEDRYITEPAQYRTSSLFNELVRCIIFDWQEKHYDNSLNYRALSEKQRESDALKNTSKTTKMDEQLKTMSDDIKKRELALEEHEREIEYLKKQLQNKEKLPILYQGAEKELYNGEVKDFVLMAVQSMYETTPPGSRRYDVLKDIIESNEYEMSHVKRREVIKNALKGYKNISSQTLKQALNGLGLTLTDGGKHFKVTYYDDDRYQAIISSTPSDSRAGTNMATLLNKLCN